MNPRTTALALLAALALAVAGCGKDSEKGNPIPSANVTELQKQLDAIESRFEHGDGACADITNDSEPAVSRALDPIPSSVDRKVRRSLRESVAQLFRLTADQCDATQTDTTETQPDTTPTEPQTDTQTETQQTETQQTQTQQTETQPQPPGQEKPKKPKKPKGPGNGNGGGPAAPGTG